MKARLTGNSRAGLLLFLAVYTCALAALLPVLSLWLDEIYDLIVARMDHLADVLTYVPHVSGNVPLNYVIQFASVHLLGYSAFTGRLPSAISSVIACAGVFVLARKLGLRWPLLATGIFALFPLQLRYAMEARPYELALCLSVWATVAFLRVLERPESGSRAQTYAEYNRLSHFRICCSPWRISCGWVGLSNPARSRCGGPPAVGIAD
jgi:uncharacterized membrane protein